MKVVWLMFSGLFFVHGAFAIQPPLHLWVGEHQNQQPTSKTLYWNSVGQAAKYNVYINNRYYNTTSATSIMVTSLSYGENDFYVTSITQDERISSRSQSFTFSVLKPTSQTSLVDLQTPKNQRPGYQLVFSDEFNGYNIDSNKWLTRKMWGPDTIVNNEKQYYVDIQDSENQSAIGYNPFKFNGSTLSIEAMRTPDDKKWMVHNQPYLSGVLTSYKKYSTKYGYFEARIKIPAQNGTFPAFWLLHERLQNENTKRSEIDIFENLGHRPDRIHNTAHYFNNVTGNYTGDHVQLSRPEIYGEDFSLTFHTYAVEWQPGYIAWFIDGVKVNEIYTHELDHEEMYVLVNLAMGGNWVNNADWGGLGYNFPNEQDLNNPNIPKLEIDYIRVYKKF